MALKKKSPAAKKAPKASPEPESKSEAKSPETFVALYGLDRFDHTIFVDDRPTQTAADKRCTELLETKPTIVSTTTTTLPLTDLADHRRKYGYGI